MPEAWIGEAAASLDAAAAAAARLLAAAALPLVIGGLGTDVDAAEAACRLAQKLGGVLDLADSDEVLAEWEATQSGGLLLTTPPQARAGADLCLLLGHLSPADLGLEGRPAAADGQPQVLTLALPGPPEARLAALGTLRACAGGAATLDATALGPELAACAERLGAARYAVIAWRADECDALALAMLAGLIDDLNGATRAAGLPIRRAKGPAGAAQAIAWRCGFPCRVGFARGVPEHDPWRFRAERLLASGEADAALRFGPWDGDEPPWRGPAPLVQLSPADQPAPGAAVSIAIGVAGEDHDTFLFDPGLGAISFRHAGQPSARPRAADVLARIEAALDAQPAAC